MATVRKGVAEAEAAVKRAGDFLAALERPENAAILGILRDKQRGKMTAEALERGKALLGGGRAALADSAAGKAEVPNLTNEVLTSMWDCHSAIQLMATHVRGHLKENPEGLPAEKVKTLAASFNRLIDGSGGQAALPNRLMNLVVAARQKPEESDLADLIAKAGIDVDDLARAEKLASTAIVTDSNQEAGKGSKRTRVSAKDQIIGSLQGWYSRWSGVAYHVLTPDQQAAVTLAPHAPKGRPKKPAPPAPEAKA